MGRPVGGAAENEEDCVATVSCPKCGSLTGQAGFPVWVIVVAICFFPLGLLALLAGRKPTQCGACGHVWQA